METPIATTIPQATPMQTSTPAPATIDAPAPQPQVSMPKAGMTFKAFLSTVNWVEISFGIVGATALFYTIYYYRYKLQIDKLMTNNMQKQIDDLNVKLQDEINNNQTQQNVATSFNGMFNG